MQVKAVEGGSVYTHLVVAPAKEKTRQRAFGRATHEDAQTKSSFPKAKVLEWGRDKDSE